MNGPTKPTRNQLATAQKKELNWKWWAFGIAILILLIVVAQNSQKVKFNVLFLSTDAPLILLLLLAAIVGAVIGYTGPILRRHRHNTRKEYQDD